MFLIHMIHRVFRVTDTLNQTLQAKSKTVHEILTQSTVCLIKLEEKKSKYQSFFNKMVERATVFKINAPEAMVLNENDRATKKVVIVTSTQKKRKANSGTPVNQTRQAMSALQALTEINDVPVEYDIFEKMYKESFSLYIKYKNGSHYKGISFLSFMLTFSSRDATIMR